MQLIRCFSVVIISICIGQFALAEIGDGQCGDARKALVTTDHLIQINGHQIKYSATAGFVEVSADDVKAKACVFYTAYVVLSISDKPVTNRPLTFAFNGGPGSASLWLHMGFLGPRRVDMGKDGMNAPQQTTVINNEFSPIETTDIVMIDPVATGFSHAVGETKEDKFFGVKNDYKSMATFIQAYINLNNRWLSPKFILGESYGGIRGTLLARHLQSEFSIGISGLILVSPALSWTSLDFETPDNNVPYWTFLPTFATTAWYHKKIASVYQSMSVAEVYVAAKKFADSQFRDALEMGNTLSNTQYNSVIKTLSEFTGINPTRLNELNLRIDDGEFFGQALHDERQVVGRFDSRFTGAMTGHRPGKGGWIDPSDSATSYHFVAAINHYLRADLNFPLTSPYEVIADVGNWAYDSDGQTFGVLNDLTAALADNPNLKVLIASGYFDLACPMGTVEYELSQIQGGANIRSRITQTKYFGGHMMYINTEAASQLKNDVTSFINSQVGVSQQVQPRQKQTSTDLILGAEPPVSGDLQQLRQ